MQREFNRVRRGGASLEIAMAAVFLLAPATLIVGEYFFSGKAYHAFSALILLYALLFFLMMFERKKPRMREVSAISILTIIGVLLRAVFFMAPRILPMTAIAIITGASLGAQSGFLTGALSVYISNFIFGQGPRAPWQMFAVGIIGFAAGMIFEKRIRRYKPRKRQFMLCAYGAAAAFLCGTAVEARTLAALAWTASPFAAIDSFISATPLNLEHSVVIVIILALTVNPIMNKLDRAKLKFGLMGNVAMPRDGFAPRSHGGSPA
ncbi:MAG: ECF transporter S component [Clostridiales Family XIII bacterium]|jgi:uncharacterized membrane protein|nr:ECF transporter S component [Clostridiales Family XIII bacterium]